MSAQDGGLDDVRGERGSGSTAPRVRGDSGDDGALPAAAETAEREARHPDGGRHPRFSDTQGRVELRMIREGEEAGSSRQEGPMAGAGIDKGASVLSASEDTLLNEIESELLNEAEAQLPNATGP